MPRPSTAFAFALLAGTGAALVAIPPVAWAQSARTVDGMTCAEAKRTVKATGRYEKRTGFGSVPIMGVLVGPSENSATCPIRSSPSFFIERTRDVPACVLGYSCERKGPRG